MAISTKARKRRSSSNSSSVGLGSVSPDLSNLMFVFTVTDLSVFRFPTTQTRMTLTDIIESEQCFVKVRTEACYCLAKVANAMISNFAGPPVMLNIFRKLFGSFSCPGIIKHNDFSNLQHYYLQKVADKYPSSLQQ